MILSVEGEKMAAELCNITELIINRLSFANKNYKMPGGESFNDVF